MARQTKPLSVKEIESANPKEADYVLYDGDGLELLIKSSGSKIWQFLSHSHAVPAGQKKGAHQKTGNKLINNTLNELLGI